MEQIKVSTAFCILLPAFCLVAKVVYCSL